MAGSFYPALSERLRVSVRANLRDARAKLAQRKVWPKALIVPHAGYVYSGPIAASGYVLLEPAAGKVERVVAVGPSHRVAFEGLAVPSARAFDTPLGRVPIDTTSIRRLTEVQLAQVLDDAHQWEHSLEVQLPFLQETLGAFSLVPIVVGRAQPDQVAKALDLLWGGDETVVVISSDLSHYLDYDTARRIDAQTARAIEALEPSRISEHDACGRIGIQGLLAAALARSMAVQTLDLRNSGDTAGGRAEVVGYGAWAIA